MMAHRRYIVSGVFVLALLAALNSSTVAAAEGDGPACFSGRYPHLAMFNSGGECGVGAVVPWADRLWVITYSQHSPGGSDDKLYEIDPDLHRITRPESIGGTPANRMIHRESNQLNIGPYFIDDQRQVRAVPYDKMYGRLTGTARHLSDPANKLYIYDMEGLVYEVDVHTLEPKLLFKRPVPGWHGKGGYSGQGRLVLANNGEHAAGSVNQYQPFDYFIDPKRTSDEDAGALAEWDGQTWRLVLRRQFTDVTGPGGIYGPPNDEAPLWAIGWDRRSLLLELCDGGQWSTFRLPIADYSYVATHGWHTEWPRIREVTGGKFLMNLHGGWFDFPPTFSAGNGGGLRALGSYLKVTGDFCGWNGRIVFGCDDTTVAGFSHSGVGDTLNRLNAQSCSNLWFTTWDDLAEAGSPAGFGGPWVGDDVQANVPSEPFLLAGLRKRCLHLAVNADVSETSGVARCTEKYQLAELPAKLASAIRVTVRRGDYHEPAPAWFFVVDRDVVVHLAVDERGDPEPGEGWRKTDLKLTWDSYSDAVFVKEFKAGRVEIPGNAVEHTPNAYGLPHLCFVEPADGGAAELEITELPEAMGAKVFQPGPAAPPADPSGATFTLEIDRQGDGTWAEYTTVAMPDSGYMFHVLPDDLQTTWIRLKPDRDVANVTAYFHCGPGGGAVTDRKMFQALADVADTAGYHAAVVRNESDTLGVLARVVDATGKASPDASYQIGADLQFRPTTSDSASAEFLRDKVVVQDPVIQIDEASVIVHEGNFQVRLPKSHASYDEPWPSGLPRAMREVVTERSLLNAAGIFYVLPRSNSGGVRRIKPICTHDKRITDFCSWRGMLVIAGTRADPDPTDPHYLRSGDGQAGVWLGDIDDLWKLGKPRGRGGPWRATAVEAGRPSDPYLMTGFDKKTLDLSHDADEAVKFQLEVDILGLGKWLPYPSITVPPGQTVTHRFPDGYQAHWVRVTTDRDCRATAWFTYE